MSIKRTKQRSYSRRGDDDTASFFSSPKPAETEKTWEEHMSGQPDSAFVPYALASRFEKGVLVLHAKFGKGVVLAVEGTRIDVLFAEGRKKLGHAPG